MSSEVADRFDAVIAALNPAMVIVTTVSGGERAGCLVGFHSQCSIEPLRYVVWLSKANRTYEVALGAELLALHVVTGTNHALAELFGGATGDEVDKFGLCAWHEGPSGLPILDEAGGHLLLRRLALIDTDNDHVGFVCEPIDGIEPEDRRLIRLTDVADVDPGHEETDRRWTRRRRSDQAPR